MTLIMELKAVNGMLKIYNDKVIVSRKTLSGIVLQGLKGDKTFFYRDLSSIEYKKPGIFTNGYIKFITAGTQESNQNIGKYGIITSTAMKDPNTVILRSYKKEKGKKIDKAYEYILERMNECKNGNGNVIVNQSSNADEILKYKNLLDKGIITQEEFNRKKQDLLK